MLNRLKLIIATGFGTGYAPVASGTFGTLVGILVVGLISAVNPLVYMALTVALLWVGIKCSDYAETYFQKSDAGEIVIDEIVGYMVTMYLVPVSIKSLIIGFFVFRVMDIVKPWPAKQIDQGNMGGLGVMLDDVAAGIWGCIFMHIFHTWTY